jgi:hypothetical protein
LSLFDRDTEGGKMDMKWDPLEENRKLQDLTSELASATIKRQIKNILKSYTGWYDPLSELIQNSLDAVEQRRKRETRNYEPIVWIKIDLEDDTICVTDNGVGFSEEEFKSFLAPNVSFKTDSRGNKGVGATYLGYGFNFLQIGTKTPDFSYIGLNFDTCTPVWAIKHLYGFFSPFV